MTNSLWAAVRDIWFVFQEASLYVLFGFLVAAAIQATVSPRRITAILGRGRIRSSILGSLIGVPLPLCSCSVLPTALALKKKGARRAGAVSFLIATPETGVDSIVLTYGLMDPIMTVFRPLSAMVTGTVAGFLTDRFGGPEAPADDGEPGACAPGEESDKEPVPWRVRLTANFRMLFNDLSHWIFIGLVLSGLITWAVPPKALEGVFGGGILPMLAMLVIGFPLYICASGSTPLAAALIYKGLSPGAALVFLVVGPATNIGAMGIIAGNFGKRTLVIYLATLAVLSIILGVAVNSIYAELGIDPITTMGAAGDIVPGVVRTFATLVLFLLLFQSLRRTPAPKELASLGEWLRRHSGIRITARRTYAAVLALVILGYLSTAVFTVSPGEVGMVRRFGKLVRQDLSPGIYIDLPRPFAEVTRSPVRTVQALTIGFRPTSEIDDLGYHRFNRLRRQGEPDREYFCGDWNLLDVNCSVLYRIGDPERFHFDTETPRVILEEAVRAVLVEILSSRDVDLVFTKQRPLIEQVVERRLARELDEYGVGIELVDFSLLDVHAPEVVHPVFRAVAGAAEERLATILSASAEAVVTRTDAVVERTRAVNDALGAAEVRIRDASGFSCAFGERADAFELNPDGLGRHMTLETVSEVLPKVEKRLVPVPGEELSTGIWFFPASPGRTGNSKKSEKDAAGSDFPFFGMEGPE
jgi:uncharacterized membrane protein YraQ (UPF0718 family)/regulator of protease activity HflC (stomatin/prohibitin superfamily)